jgi:subtilisin family serine protease
MAVFLVVGSIGVFLGSAPAFGAGTQADGISSSSAGDPVRAQEWWLASLNVTQAWRTTRGAGVTVAVLGTGVAASHPDLAGDVVTGPDYTGSGRTPGGPFWGIDGTQVASIIAGHGHGPGRQSGIVGVAPAARILSVRVNLEFNDPLNSDQAVARHLPGAIADGIIYAVDHGARVIDLPLDPGTFGLTGGEDPAAAGGSRAEQEAVAYALRKSVVLVGPAGDDGEGPGLVDYPAAYTGVIAVGAVSPSGRLAPFSSRRSYVTLTAPGVGLLAATPPDDYAAVSSTSAASGIVAGVAALLLSRYPHLTVAQVTQALTKSTVTPGGTAAADNADGPGTGYGTVDAARAVSLAALITSASQAHAATPAPTPNPAEPRPPTSRPGAARTGASARRTDVSALAGSLVRDVVVGLGVLIVLLIVLIGVLSSRRKRISAAGSLGSGQAGAPRPGRDQRPQRAQGTRGSQGTRGQHEHRRADRAPMASHATGPRARVRPELASPGAALAPVPPLVPVSPLAPGTPLAALAPGTPLAPALPGAALPPGTPGTSIAPLTPVPPGAIGWPAPGGWQGGSLGEIAHPPGPPMRPVIAAVPRTANPLRGGRSTADASPPWAPAPEPEETSDPFPVAPVGLFMPPPGPGLRVPRDVPGPLAFTTQPPAPDTPAAAGPTTGPDVTQTATGPDVTQTATGPDVTEAATGPDVMGAATDPDITRTADTPRAAWPTRQSRDFATAPVATSRPGPAPPDEDDTIVFPGPAVYPGDAAVYPGDAPPVATDGRPPPGPPIPGSGPVADPNSIWDLAATDVFPAVAPQAPDDEAPGASLR